MPSVAVPEDRLAALIGHKYTAEELEKKLLDYGVEVDDVYEEDGRQMLKLDIGANRYDLLCAEGLGQSLRTYINGEKYQDIAKERTVEGGIPPSGLIVQKYQTDERPYLACGVIRGVDLSGDAYDSFISYQDKLHTSIGRNRSIVSMGTHDLDKMAAISDKIIYNSTDLSAISFTPLNGDREIKASELRAHLSGDKKLSKCFDLLKNPERSVVFLCGSTVMSVPPIINSEATKITQQTRDIFIEVTGTDFQRVNTALKMVLYNFRGTRIESVRIVEPEEGKEVVTPVFLHRSFTLSAARVSQKLKVELSRDDIKSLLEKMEYRISFVNGNDSLTVDVLDVRSDVMHECDIIEDIAVSYGFNNFKRSVPEIATAGRENPLNRFADKLRQECALSGFNEVLTLSLLSRSENIVDPDHQVVLANPMSRECEVVRTALLPGLLKAVASNQHVRLPLRLFEVADVVLTTGDEPEGARNERRLCALVAGNTSMLEDVHGPLSMLFEKCGIRDYHYTHAAAEHLLENQTAAVFVGKKQIGLMGVIHPQICRQFKIPYAMSAVEIDVEALYSAFLERN